MYVLQPAFINLHHNDYSEEFYYYPLTVKLDKCVRSCDTPNDLSNKICVPNKTEDLSLSVFNIIRGISEPKTIIKHISCQGKCKFDTKKSNSNQWWNNDKCRCEYKKDDIWEKDYISKPSTCICENGKYSANIMDDSAISCAEIIEKTITTNFNEKNVTCKS